MAEQTDIHMRQSHIDVPTMEGCGTGAEIIVDVVQLVQEVGGHAGGGGGTFQIPGVFLEPNI